MFATRVGLSLASQARRRTLKQPQLGLSAAVENTLAAVAPDGAEAAAAEPTGGFSPADDAVALTNSAEADEGAGDA